MSNRVWHIYVYWDMLKILKGLTNARVSTAFMNTICQWSEFNERAIIKTDYLDYLWAHMYFRNSLH